MTKPVWVIRLYDPSDYNKTNGWATSLQSFGDRQNDDIIVFSGLYGLDEWLVWEMSNDQLLYDFSTSKLELNLYLSEALSVIYWSKSYRTVDISYDPNKSKFVLYALSETSLLLRSPLFPHGIDNLIYDEGRLSYEVLEEILTGAGIVEVVYEQPPSTLFKEFQYNDFTIDIKWTVSDLINHVCNVHDLEWCATDFRIYISKELRIDRRYNSTKTELNSSEVFSSSPFFHKYSGEARTISLKSHIMKSWKCVWVKHWAGKSGGVTKACFTERGAGGVDKHLYFDCLEGKRERENAALIFNKHSLLPSVSIGNIIKDEGESTYIDQVSIQKDKDNLFMLYPNNVKIDGNDSKFKSTNIEDNICRTSPYLEDGGGLIFPSVDLTKPAPNSLIFKVDGKSGSSAIGPFVFGNGKDLSIPTKADKKDLKLILPNGWCLYIDGTTGETIIQQKDFPVDGKGTPTGTYIHIKPDGSIILEGSEIKLGENALFGVATLTDAVDGSIGFLAWLNTHLHPVPGGPPVPTFIGTTIGAISQASDKIKAE